MEFNDNQTNIEILKEKVKVFCEERDWAQFHSPKDLAITISTEAAELLEIFRYKTDDQIKDIFSNPEKKKQIFEELSDILFPILRFIEMNDIDLTHEFIEKMKKNAEKYPVEKVKGLNKKYTEY